MTPILTFVLGILATWIGLLIGETVKRKNRRYVTAARLYGNLEAGYRIMVSVKQLAPFLTLHSHFQQRRMEALKATNQLEAIGKITKEIAEITETLGKNGQLDTAIKELKSQIGRVSADDRNRLMRILAEARTQLTSGDSFPSDEDLTSLDYTFFPYAMEYRQRALQFIILAEDFIAPSMAEQSDTIVASRIQGFIEQILYLLQLSDLLRTVTSNLMKRKKWWR